MAKIEIDLLCRICLEDGAIYPIFGETNNENSIHSKLKDCFTERIEDVEGYPRNVCPSCMNTIEAAYNFVTKLKESAKLLKDGLLKLKRENDSDTSENEAETCVDIEIAVNSIKHDPDAFIQDDDYTEDIIEYLQPIRESEHSQSSITCDKKPLINKKFGNKTRKVASSILEGEFTWTGEKWCITSCREKLPRVKRDKQQRRDTRLILPKRQPIKSLKLCDICGEVFKTQYRLTVHRKKAHLNTPVPCPKCTRILTSEYNLKCHIKRKHIEQKDHICPRCGKGFAFKGELTHHINRMHTNKIVKKMFNCKHCNKTYKCLKSTVIHERSVHTGERPAECTVCDKSFYHEDYLKEHMRLHTGEAPFKCPICSRGYAQRGNMKSHMKQHRRSEVDSVTLSKLKPNYLKLLKL